MKTKKNIVISPNKQQLQIGNTGIICNKYFLQQSNQLNIERENIFSIDKCWISGTFLYVNELPNIVYKWTNIVGLSYDNTCQQVIDNVTTNVNYLDVSQIITTKNPVKYYADLILGDYIYKCSFHTGKVLKIRKQFYKKTIYLNSVFSNIEGPDFVFKMQKNKIQQKTNKLGIINTLTKFEEGKNGQCIDFKEGLLKYDNLDLFSKSTTFTMSFWLKFNSFPEPLKYNDGGFVKKDVKQIIFCQPYKDNRIGLQLSMRYRQSFESSQNNYKYRFLTITTYMKGQSDRDNQYDQSFEDYRYDYENNYMSYVDFRFQTHQNRSDHLQLNKWYYFLIHINLYDNNSYCYCNNREISYYTRNFNRNKDYCLQDFQNQIKFGGDFLNQNIFDGKIDEFYIWKNKSFDYEKVKYLMQRLYNKQFFYKKVNAEKINIVFAIDHGKVTACNDQDNNFIEVSEQNLLMRSQQQQYYSGTSSSYYRYLILNKKLYYVTNILNKLSLVTDINGNILDNCISVTSGVQRNNDSYYLVLCINNGQLYRLYHEKAYKVSILNNWELVKGFSDSTNSILNPQNSPIFAIRDKKLYKILYDGNGWDQDQIGLLNIQQSNQNGWSDISGGHTNFNINYSYPRMFGICNNKLYALSAKQIVKMSDIDFKSVCGYSSQSYSYDQVDDRFSYENTRNAFALAISIDKKLYRIHYDKIIQVPIQGDCTCISTYRTSTGYNNYVICDGKLFALKTNDDNDKFQIIQVGDRNDWEKVIGLSENGNSSYLYDYTTYGIAGGKLFGLIRQQQFLIDESGYWKNITTVGQSQAIGIKEI